VADYSITSPKLQVLRGSLDAPEVLEVQTLNPDLIAWDMAAARHKWPGVKDAPFKWLTFLAWHACRREGRIPSDLRYEEWEASTLNVSSVEEGEGDSGKPVDPTQGEAEPD
jgi:hypothetical protein